MRRKAAVPRRKAPRLDWNMTRKERLVHHRRVRKKGVVAMGCSSWSALGAAQRRWSELERDVTQVLRDGRCARAQCSI